ncbi:hypothetical protein [Streptomyces sp. NPDC005438]|uniref:hypothetical protein n=1 Tax=Streptomyces sp. NPDC005438 TaxID=3156880 RepID=UPI0033A4E182
MNPRFASVLTVAVAAVALSAGPALAATAEVPASESTTTQAGEQHANWDPGWGGCNPCS